MLRRVTKPEQLMRPKARYRCLGARVLVAAQFVFDDVWAAWILPVPGKCFDEEVSHVYAEGSLLEAPLARFLFPEFADYRYKGD